MTQSFEQYRASSNKDTAQKSATFAFGRFQPMTKGHSRLIETVIEIASDTDSTPMIFPSGRVDSPKNPTKNRNPLQPNVKRKFLETLFPNAPFVFNESVISPFHVIDFLQERKFTDITFVVGSDRIDEFTTRWLPYANKSFDTATIKTAGMRDVDGDETSGMSATRARSAALIENIGAFRAATGWSGITADYLMRAVRDGLLNTTK